ncbi:MAG: glutamine synthetase beta-grasp domain-containing protein [Eisenbergiella massiliensis]
MGKSEKVLQLCRENSIRMIDFKMVDLDGRWRHITIPLERFGDSIFTQGIGFDGSNYGYAPIEKSDMVFIPDPDSAVIDPFAEIPTLSMTGDVCVIGTDENRPFDQYPRNVALRAAEYMKQSGGGFYCDRAEFEFIFDTVNYQASQRRFSRWIPGRPNGIPALRIPATWDMR